jgi:hypothetical protein
MTVEQAAARGAVVIGLAQADREIKEAIAQMRNGDAAALGTMCKAVDLLTQSYRAGLEVLNVVPFQEPRVWTIDVDARTVAL